MSCAICGKPTLIGARLCSPCRAALKRAKDDTVFELPPGLAEAAARRRASAPMPLVEPSADAPARRSRPLRMLALGLACAGAFGATAVHLAAQGDERGGGFPAGDGVALSLPPAARDGPATAAGRADSQPSTPAPLPTAALLPTVAALPAPGHGPDASPSAERSDTPVTSSVPGGRPASRHKRLYETLVRAPREAAHAVRPGPPSPEASAPVVAQVAPAPAPAPVKVASAAPTPAVRADPWQGLDHALALCAGESLFARLGCEHRARARFCEGRWGDPAHCPSGVNVDHGQ